MSKGKSKDEGSALVTAIIVMLMVSMFGLAYLTLTSTSLMRAKREERRAATLYLAEAGLEYVIAQIIDQASANDGTISSQTINTDTVLDSLKTGGTGSVVVTAVTSKTATITSTANYTGLSESIRVRLKMRSIGIWNNAIFAGIGQSGRGVNGNVDIRGSVHILGDGDPFTDTNGNGVWDPAEPFIDVNGNGIFEPLLGETFTDVDGNGVWSPAETYQDANLNGQYDDPLTATDLATDMGGSALIGNNYSGIPAALQSKIPVVPTEDVGGETVQTLWAELRVKHGKVNVSGTASVGQANVTGNAYKEKLDGTYVTDGYGGNQGTDNVHSDNGYTQGYDLGDRIPFPSLQNPYTDPITGASYSKYEEYLNANSTSISHTTITGETPSFTEGSGGNTISWDQPTRTLTVTGIVKMGGVLNLGTKGETLYYQGKGTIFCQGESVYVHGSVLPKTMFPATDVMGVISKYDIEFATGDGEAQLYAAGAWYAQREIKSAKQSNFAGTYVANHFDMGTNVPSIFQVPTLADNLPPGMPGGEGVYAAQVLSWRHL
ncbi:MAG TPA: hypothetical protein VFI02_00020 [Armatimonadota bacterium]|nr:hypothetical protein [Armatimonadota bacterium]